MASSSSLKHASCFLPALLKVTFLWLIGAPSLVHAQTQVTTATKTCEDRILAEASNFVSARINAYSKCVSSAMACKLLSAQADRTNCLAKLVVPSKGNCAVGKLDAGNPTIGAGAANLSLSGVTRLEIALATLMNNLQVSCFSTPAADLSSISGGLGFPSSVTSASMLADELNRLPDGLGCYSVAQLIDSAPRAQALVDEIKGFDKKCVVVKGSFANLYLRECATDADCGTNGSCGRIAYALSLSDIGCKQPCAAGSALEGDKCVPCSTGKFADGTNQAVCSLCSPGTFGHVTGLSACIPCQKGAFASQAGATECQLCQMGYAAAQSGSTNCAGCVPGTFAAAHGQTECQLCPAGKTSGTAASGCTSCNVGKYAPLPGTSSCLNCNPGTFGDQPGQSQCTECAVGKFASNPGSSACQSCSRGSYSDLTGAAECKLCPPGKTSAEGASVCVDCQVGQFAPLPGSSTCLSCSPGTYTTRSGQSQCTDCALGQFASSVGSSLCQSCSPGRYSDVTGATQCKLCPAGKTSVSGASLCADCPVGTYAPLEGSSRCSACEQGTYSNVEGQSSCTSCEPGSFTSVTGASSCLQCQPGTFTSNAGSIQCNSCPVNSISNATHTQCLCDIGYYATAPVNGVFQCVQCPEGADCRSPGTTLETLQALPGFWSDGTSFYRCLLASQCPGGAV